MAKSRKLTVTICSSANFYKHVVELKNFLAEHGYKSLIPLTATKMEASGDYDASHYRTWLMDEKDYHKKSSLMRGHFEEVEKGDVILVINDEKHGIPHYIGGNVLIEMALAFYLHKPIILMNEIPKDSAFLEEIIAMEPLVLHGKKAALLAALV